MEYLRVEFSLRIILNPEWLNTFQYPLAFRNSRLNLSAQPVEPYIDVIGIISEKL